MNMKNAGFVVAVSIATYIALNAIANRSPAAKKILSP